MSNQSIQTVGSIATHQGATNRTSERTPWRGTLANISIFPESIVVMPLAATKLSILLQSFRYTSGQFMMLYLAN
jgi:hypothetical protein